MTAPGEFVIDPIAVVGTALATLALAFCIALCCKMNQLGSRLDEQKQEHKEQVAELEHDMCGKLKGMNASVDRGQQEAEARTEARMERLQGDLAQTKSWVGETTRVLDASVGERCVKVDRDLAMVRGEYTTYFQDFKGRECCSSAGWFRRTTLSLFSEKQLF